MAKRKAARTAGRKKTSAKRAARKAAPRRARKAARRRSAGPAKKRAAPKARKAVARKGLRKTARKAAPKAARKVARKTAPKSARRSARPAAVRQIIARKAPALNRERRIVQDEDIVPTPPSSLDLDRSASAARSGRRELSEKFQQHTETSPAITGGDIDADWESAYSVGDEAPGGDNPTPDQDIVDDIGKALGVQYRGQRGVEEREKDQRP